MSPPLQKIQSVKFLKALIEMDVAIKIVLIIVLLPVELMPSPPSTYCETKKNCKQKTKLMELMKLCHIETENDGENWGSATANRR